jgi:hypothetical protein
MNDALIEVAAAVQLLQAKLMRLGFDVGDWKIQLTKPDGKSALRAAASSSSIDFLFPADPLPPGVAARINGVDFLEPPR